MKKNRSYIIIFLLTVLFLGVTAQFASAQDEWQYHLLWERSFEGRIYLIDYSEDGRKVVISVNYPLKGQDGDAEAEDYSAKDRIFLFDGKGLVWKKALQGFISGIEITPDGENILVDIWQDPFILSQLYNSSGKLLWEKKVPIISAHNESFPSQGFKFSTDGRYLLSTTTGEPSREVKVYNLDGKIVWEAKLPFEIDLGLVSLIDGENLLIARGSRISLFKNGKGILWEKELFRVNFQSIHNMIKVNLKSRLLVIVPEYPYLRRFIVMDLKGEIKGEGLDPDDASVEGTIDWFGDEDIIEQLKDNDIYLFGPMHKMKAYGWSKQLGVRDRLRDELDVSVNQIRILPNLKYAIVSGEYNASGRPGQSIRYFSVKRVK